MERLAENKIRQPNIICKAERFESHEDVPKELQDDFLYLEVITFFKIKCAKIQGQSMVPI